MGDVDIAEVLFRQDVFPDLIALRVSKIVQQVLTACFLPVNEDIVHGKRQNEVDQLLLHLLVALLPVVGLALLLAPKIQRVYGLAIHLAVRYKEWWWSCVCAAMFARHRRDSVWMWG